MNPLSQNAIKIFGLISANARNQSSVHINVLIHVAKQPKIQVEAALIELMTEEYVQYDIPTQHVFISKRRKHDDRKRNHLGVA